MTRQRTFRTTSVAALVLLLASQPAAAYREYQATLARFAQRDPLEFGSGLNKYGFGGQSPMSASDPRLSPGGAFGYDLDRFVRTSNANTVNSCAGCAAGSSGSVGPLQAVVTTTRGCTNPEYTSDCTLCRDEERCIRCCNIGWAGCNSEGTYKDCVQGCRDTDFDDASALGDGTPAGTVGSRGGCNNAKDCGDCAAHCRTGRRCRQCCVHAFGADQWQVDQCKDRCDDRF